jgi:hypothetical protein
VATELNYFVRFKPAVAKRMILDAYRNAKGNAVHAAGHLNISHPALIRYVRELQLAPDIRKIRKAAGAKGRVPLRDEFKRALLQLREGQDLLRQGLAQHDFELVGQAEAVIRTALKPLFEEFDLGRKDG